MNMKKAASIDEFIASYPTRVQAVLRTLRRVIKAAAPEAGEKISYGIPTFTLHGNLIHFSAYEKHVGLYPGSGPVREFAAQLKKYETAKGTIRFPIDKPLPLALIRKIVKSCVKHNLARRKAG
jgi:uncharacterized protein YdhG (YjbR/CyaY superfamily)